MARLIVYIFILNIITFVNSSVQAQPPTIIKIAKECSTPSLKKNLYFLASDKMEGRMMASHGDTLASLFVADEFKKAGLIAPYHGKYFQSITATKETAESYITFSEKSFKELDGWYIYPSAELLLHSIPILYNQFTDLNSLSNYINHADVKARQ
jgi:hypothetical protein